MSRFSRRLQQGTANNNAGSVPPAATPGDVSGLTLWLKADSILGVSNGASVSNWPDSSANNLHATNAMVAEQPLFISNAANGLPVVRFNGDRALYSAARSGLAQQTVVAVVKPTALSGSQTIRGGALQILLSDNHIAMLEQSVRGIAHGFRSPSTTEFQVVTCMFRDSIDYGFRLGRVNIGYGPSDVGGLDANATTAIGHHLYWGEGFSGDIAEVACWNRVLNELELEAIIAGLRSKWAALYLPDPSPPPSGTFTGTKVAIIGDSLTDQMGLGAVDVPAALEAAGWPNGGIYYYGLSGKTINEPDSGGKTTVQNIQECRAGFGEPDVWIISLGSNDLGSSNAQIEADIASVHAELGPNAKVMWNTLAQSNIDDANRLRFNNEIISGIVTARPHTYLADWFAYVFTHDQTGWWSDGVHMTQYGYGFRNAYNAARSIEASFI